MKKTSLVSLAILFAVTMLLTGCLFPYWADDGGRGHGGRGGGHHEGGGGGHRGGGDDGGGHRGDDGDGRH
jgi:hypothetical protein